MNKNILEKLSAAIQDGLKNSEAAVPPPVPMPNPMPSAPPNGLNPNVCACIRRCLAEFPEHPISADSWNCIFKCLKNSGVPVLTWGDYVVSCAIKDEL